MPFVRIYLKKGTTVEFRQQISQSVHSSLVKEFSIPEDDLFQVIEEVEPHNLFYPGQYLGIAHSEKIIYIQITAKAGRSQLMKQSLYRSIANEIYCRTQHSPEDIVTILTENSEADWSFGRGEAQLVGSSVD